MKETWTISLSPSLAFLYLSLYLAISQSLTNASKQATNGCSSHLEEPRVSLQWPSTATEAECTQRSVRLEPVRYALENNVYQAGASTRPGKERENAGHLIRLPLPFKSTQTFSFLPFRPEDGLRRGCWACLWNMQLLRPLLLHRSLPQAQGTAHALRSPDGRHRAGQCKVVDGQTSACCSSYLQVWGTQGQRPPMGVTWPHKTSIWLMRQQKKMHTLRVSACGDIRSLAWPMTPPGPQLCGGYST